MSNQLTDVLEGRPASGALETLDVEVLLLDPHENAPWIKKKSWEIRIVLNINGRDPYTMSRSHSPQRGLSAVAAGGSGPLKLLLATGGATERTPLMGLG